MNTECQFFCPCCGHTLTVSGSKSQQAQQVIREIPLHTRKGTSRLGFRHVWSDEDEAELEENESLEENNAGIPFVSQIKQTAKAFYGHKAVRSEIRYFSNGASKADPTIKSHTYERKPQYKIDLLYEWCLPIGMGAAISACVTMFLYLLNLSLTPIQGLFASFGSWILVSMVGYREIQKRVTGEKVTTTYHEPKPQPDIIQKVETVEHTANITIKHNAHSHQMFKVKLPVDDKIMRKIALHLKHGGSFGRISLCRGQHKVLSGYKYRELKQVLVDRKMAVTKGKKTELRASGLALFKSYLEGQNVTIEA